MEGKEVINEKHEGREEENHQVWNRTWDETQIHGYIRERKKGRKNERKGGEKTGSFVTNILILIKPWSFLELKSVVTGCNSSSMSVCTCWYDQTLRMRRCLWMKSSHGGCISSWSVVSTEESWENIYNARGTSSAEIQLVVCLYCVMYVDFKVWCPCFFCMCFQPWLRW